MAPRKQPRDQLLFPCPDLDPFLRAGDEGGKDGNGDEFQACEWRGPDGAFWGCWHAKPGDCASLQGCSVWTASPGRIHQSDLRAAQQLWGAKRPLPCLNINPSPRPKALTDVRCTSFQFSKFSLTFHL